MATFNAPPTGTSILAYAPFFPNGAVNDAWSAWFTSLYNTVITGPVQSFNGRTGFVNPAANDYSFAQLSGAASSAQIATALTTPGAIGGTTPSTVNGTTITATTQFTGPGTGLSGTANALSIGGNAATVTTIPNLTGDVTSVGNTTMLAPTQPGAHTWSQVQNISNTTASTSPTTGALVVAGGVGVAGQLNGALCVFGTGALLGNATLTYNQMLTLQSSSGSAWKFGTTDIGGSALNITCDFGSFTINKTTGNVGTPGSFVATTSFIGPGTGLTGTAASLTAGTATNATQLGGVAAASYALLASPTFTGTPAAPTATVGTNTTQLATTAFVLANAGAASRLKRTVFTSSGSWTCPTGVTFADVTLAGGGGAGGDNDGVSNGGGGGGAGATLVERIPVTAGTQYDITIGAGGTISLGAAGNNGTDTTFATHLGATLATAKGGIGGGYGGAGGAGAASGGVDPQLGGAAGVLSATAGNSNSLAYPLALRFGCFIPGGGGGDGGTASVASKIGGKCESYNGGSITGNKLGGNGGASPWGPGGNGATSAASASSPTANTAAGGGGGSFVTVARNPAAGASGYAIVDAVY